VTGLATLSALIWNGIIIYAGAFIGKSWQEIQEYINLYNKIIFSVLITAGIIALIYYFLFKRKKRGDEV